MTKVDTNKLIIVFGFLFMVSTVSAYNGTDTLPKQISYNFDAFTDTTELTIASAPVIGNNAWESNKRIDIAEKRLNETHYYLEEDNEAEANSRLQMFNNHIENVQTENIGVNESEEINKGLDNISNRLEDIRRETNANIGLETAIHNTQSIEPPKENKNSRIPNIN